MTPNEYLRIEMAHRKIIADAERIISKARKKADKCPWPAKTRPCEPNDIRPMAIIWHKQEKTEFSDNFWNIVDKSLHYGDGFKAYIADDGSRYGLHNAFIELK